MFHYLLRRLLIGLVTLGLISFLIYGLVRAMPGDPIAAIQADMDPAKKVNQADLENMRRIYGLDKPWYLGYRDWIWNVVVRRDLARSITRKQPVTTLIRERLGPTLMLSVSSLLLAYGLSIPIGLRSMARHGSWEERVSSVLLYMLYSMPVFVAALFLQILFAVKLNWFPLMGMHGDRYSELSWWGQTWDSLRHAFLPVACFTYASLAYDVRFIKSNLAEVVRQDYVRTARAKGASESRALVVHAFRNTLIPFVTMLGLSLPTLLGGAVILEQIFSWPGMGRLFFEALRERDYPTIMGLTMTFSVLTLLGQLLADILYAVVDPRVSYS